MNAKRAEPGRAVIAQLLGTIPAQAVKRVVNFSFGTSTSLGAADHPVRALLQNLIGNSRVGALNGCRPRPYFRSQLFERLRQDEPDQFHVSPFVAAVSLRPNVARGSQNDVQDFTASGATYDC